MEKINKKPLNIIFTIILSVALFALPVCIMPGDNYNYIKMIVLYICGGGLAVTFAIGANRIKANMEDFFLLGFGIIVVISTLLSLNVEKSIFGEWQRYEGLIAFFTYFLIYLSAKNYFVKYKQFENIGLIIYTAICVFAIVQFFMPSDVSILPLFGKGANGTFGNVNFFGSFVSIILPLFMYKYIETGEKKYIISAGISAGAMMACVTRSSWVAFACVYFIFVIYIMQKDKKELRKKFGVLTIVIVIVSVTMLLAQGANSIILKKFGKIGSDVEKFSNNGLVGSLGAGRINIWKWCSRAVVKSPLIGCGVDALSVGLLEYFGDEYLSYVEKSKTFIDKAHNEYLHIAVTMGIPALLLYLGFLGTIIVKAIKKIETDPKTMMILIAIISYVVQAFFNISTIGVAPIFWFLLGIMSRQVNNIKEEKEN